jgi:hypothetical protein
MGWPPRASIECTDRMLVFMGPVSLVFGWQEKIDFSPLLHWLFWERSWVQTRGSISRCAVCDRTTSKMRDLSSKIISRDSQWSENTQIQHISIQYHIKFKLKLLHIKCHVLEFTKGETPNDASKDNQSFAEAFISHDRHTLFTLEESGPPRMTYTCES